MKRRDFLRAASGGAAVTAAAGGADAAALPDSPAAPGQESGTTTSNATTTASNGTSAPNGTTTSGGGGGGETHEVAMEGTSFTPAELTIAPGDTVVWTTTGTAPHSVTAYEDEIPGEAEYFASGGFDSQDAAESGYPDQGAVAEGESYEHTFEVVGSYGYFCIPHETAGMVGTVEVAEGGSGGDGGGGAEMDPHDMGVPFLAHYVGIATILMMVLSLIYTFFVVKYGGSPHASSPGRGK